jgi:hypothetical protein
LFSVKSELTSLHTGISVFRGCGGGGGRLVTFFSTRRPGFDPGAVRERFAVDQVALGQDFHRVLRPSPVSIIPVTLYTYLQVNTTLNRRSRNLQTNYIFMSDNTA